MRALKEKRKKAAFELYQENMSTQRAKSMEKQKEIDAERSLLKVLPSKA